MFSSALVCLFVSRMTQKTTQAIFTEIGGKMAHRTQKKKPLDFDSSRDHYYARVRARFGLGWVTAISPYGRIIPGVCLTVTILRRERPWRMRSTECGSHRLS